MATRNSNLSIAKMEAVSALVERIRWQGIVLDSVQDRAKLLGLTPAWPLAPLVLRVHRNHAFEFVQSPLTTYLAYAGFEPEWSISDYDDSLAFAGVDAEGPSQVDAEILWLDFGRYQLEPTEIADWLESRLTHLRSLSPAPILLSGPLPSDGSIATALADVVSRIRGVRLLDTATALAPLGERSLDPARAEFQGTRLSRAAQLLLARELGLKWLPAAVAPRIKAIAIDLDNTLYSGVLGEDGPAGIVVTRDHLRLQEALVALGEQGVLLTVVSKNEAVDVDRLFAERSDLKLRPSHLAGSRVNWSSKAANTMELAEEFNIAPSAFLMLDDNPGELFAAAGSIPGLSILQACADAATTVEHLSRFPGLFSFGPDSTDSLRAADLRSATQRKAALSVATDQDPLAYLKALGTQITLRADPVDEFQRLCDIPKKTNQFNLALQRLKDGDVQRYIDAPDRCVVALELRDKLSDSGNVGALFAHAEDGAIVVDELCISCRALGRAVEDIMIAEAVDFASVRLGGGHRNVAFAYRKGPRNTPALSWLKRMTGRELEVAIEGMGDETDPLHRLTIETAELRRGPDADALVGRQVG